MSAGDEIMMPIGSWGGIVALLGAGGLGGVLTALLQRPSRRAVDATAARDEATGEAAVIASLANAFTGTTGALREEIERMQDMLDDMRRRVLEAEAREAALERLVTEQRTQLELSHSDLDRVRGERDAALEKVEMLNGQLRQQQQVMASMTRTEGRA